ncbi:MAG: nucleoside deaminase [Rhodothermia bacterium]|nr:MAG: nucleoside deaminase [Rhodothermia bacterium]
MSSSPQEFMRETIRLAIENVEQNSGGPFAAIIVRNREIIATGTNRVTSDLDPTAHAEIIAIRNACTKLDSFQLIGCELYTSCEPCPMCLGAIYWARPDRIYYGASREDASAADFDDDFIYREVSLPADERSISMQQVLRQEARKVFDEWANNPDRQPY